MPSWARGAADLGRVGLVDLAAGRRRVPVVAGPVGIEAVEQPLGLDHLGKGAKTALGALLIDEEGRIGIARGIVHGHDQVPPLARHPLVGRAVLMQHHARQRPAWALAAVGSAARCFGDLAVRLERVLGPAVGLRETMRRDQLLVEVLDREILIVRLEKRQDPGHLVDRHPARRGLAEPPIDQALEPLILKAPAPAPEAA